MKKKNWNFSNILPLLAGIALIIAAFAMLLPDLMQRKQANDTYEELNEVYVKIEAPITVNDEAEEAQKVNENWWYEDVVIDIEALQEINPDIVGWIRFDHIEILSYPLLYSGDNDTYLRTDIYGKNTTAGCIFIEGANAPNLNDYHTIIYGHNMKNLSMFGSLKKYKEEGFYQDNQYFTVYLEDRAYRYQIFAYYDVPETDDVYRIGFGPNVEYRNFINEMFRRSYEDTGVNVSETDRIVTLSTCSTEGNRFVVHAVRVDEYLY